jgi:hypothetical protein
VRAFLSDGGNDANARNKMPVRPSRSRPRSLTAQQDVDLALAPHWVVVAQFFDGAHHFMRPII